MLDCFVASRRRHTMCALVTGVHTCALPIYALGQVTALPFAPLQGAVQEKARKIRRLQPKASAGSAISASAPPSIFRRSAPASGITRSPKKRAVTSFAWRSEEHTSELQSLMRISYAVFCLKKKKKSKTNIGKSGTVKSKR